MSNFLGSHAINMDAKGRLAIPARVREELAHACSGRIVLTANADEERCLLMYTEPQWEALRPQIEAAGPCHAFGAGLGGAHSGATHVAQLCAPGEEIDADWSGQEVGTLERRALVRLA